MRVVDDEHAPPPVETRPRGRKRPALPQRRGARRPRLHAQLSVEPERGVALLFGPLGIAAGQEHRRGRPGPTRMRQGLT